MGSPSGRQGRTDRARRAALLAAALACACTGGGGGESPSPDVTAPSMPADVVAVPSSATAVALSWSPSTDDISVTGYEVVRQGTVVGTTASTTFTEGGLAPLTGYCWGVRARDAAGNRSPLSSDACATTLAPPDVTPPSIVEVTPQDGARDLPPGIGFTVRFDEAVDPATLASGFTLRDEGGAVVASSTTWDGALLTATLAPAAPLENLGRYTATVSTAVTDLAGNHLAGGLGWTVRIEVKLPVFLPGAGGALGSLTATPRMAFADMDGDGSLDVVLSDLNLDVYVSLGDGGGGFSAAIPYRAGLDRSQLAGLVAADLDGDGWPDVAVAEHTVDSTGYYLIPGNVDVMLNGGAAAPGTLGSPSRLPVGIFPMAVVAADVDGDGLVDLASVERLSSQLTVLHGAGAGAFDAGVPHVVNDPVSLVAVALRPGGPIDLVPAAGPVLLNDGHGVFTAGTGAFDPGACPMDVAGGDLDGDGLVDLSTANCSADLVTVQFGDGTGAFPAALPLQAGKYPQGIRIADLNADGRPDLLVTLRQNGGIGNDGTVMLLGLGAREFGPPIPLGTGNQPVEVADVDGDGKPDLVGWQLDGGAGGYVLDVWLNRTP